MRTGVFWGDIQNVLELDVMVAESYECTKYHYTIHG
jgi:hypothetical protein